MGAAATPIQILQDMQARLTGTGDGPRWTGLAVTLGARDYLVPQTEISGIARPPVVTRVPRAAHWLRGVARLRGALLPIIDAGAALGDDEIVPDGQSRVLVLARPGNPAGFLVQRVRGLWTFAPQDQAHAQRCAAGRPADAPFLLGAFRCDGAPLPVFSLRKLAADPSLRGPAD
ncbi:MAG: chemotaxis protein CheW [Salinisphaera sp.]|nr:chemotaxis protein CheW [Salinisphaera sp.]